MSVMLQEHVPLALLCDLARPRDPPPPRSWRPRAAPTTTGGSRRRPLSRSRLRCGRGSDRVERVPEGHTVHRQAREHLARFGGRAGPAEQPAGPVRRAARRCSTGRVLEARRGLRQAPVRRLRRRPAACTSTSASTASSPSGRGAGADPARPGPAAAAPTAAATPVAYADLRGATACELITRRAARRRRRPARARPAARGRRPDPRLGAGSAAAAPRSARC